VTIATPAAWRRNARLNASSPSIGMFGSSGMALTDKCAAPPWYSPRSMVEP
jgi:hypothetical protein